MNRRLLSLVASVVLAFTAANAATAGTLENVKSRGFLQCGVNTGLPGFGNPDASGNYTGFDIDYCHAIAAAIFGDAGKVKFTPLDATQRFAALQAGEVDVLIRNTTWTMVRDTSLGFTFAGVNYYDGQGFMVKKSLGVKSLKELDGATICLQSGTDTEYNLSDYFTHNHLKFTPVALEKLPDVLTAFESGRCDAYTTDNSGLYANKLQFKHADDYLILPEVISREPLGPVVRQGDDQWFNIVKWTHMALLDAEELGVTQGNVDEMLKSDNPAIQRLLGVGTSDFGKAMGIGAKWAYSIIRAVGNYGEVFERNLGTGSKLGIERGYNRLWSAGGLQYGVPIV